MTEHINPWKIVSEKPVYHNNWISVTEFDVINPNGGKGIYGKIHFKNIAVGVLPLDEKMNTYLVGQYRFPINTYSWEVPEGGGDPTLDAQESASRELLEETGLIAKEWTVLLKMYLSNSVSDEYAVLYLARGLEQKTPMPEETEKLQIRKLPFEEVYQMVENGVITDAMSIAVIQKLKIMILDGRISK
jgi:8-oxo-dGTP pyrophosphatase MutT (NUDIX family)